MFEIGIHIYIYKKHDTLRDVAFLYANILTLRKKRQFLLRFFIYNKPDTVRYAIFHGIFEIGEGGGIFMYKKQCTFHYVFIYKKPDTLRYIFICKKQCTLRYVFISKIYCIVYSDT